MKKTNSRSSNQGSGKYECLKTLQNNRWSLWRQIPSRDHAFSDHLFEMGKP